MSQNELWAFFIGCYTRINKQKTYVLRLYFILMVLVTSMICKSAYCNEKQLYSRHCKTKSTCGCFLEKIANIQIPNLNMNTLDQVNVISNLKIILLILMTSKRAYMGPIWAVHMGPYVECNRAPHGSSMGLPIRSCPDGSHMGPT